MESPRPTQLLYTTREERGIQWPCPTPTSPSSPVLYANGFPNGRAEPGAPRFRAIPAPTETDLPAILAPGRVLLQSEREITVESGELNRIVRDEEVHINPVTLPPGASPMTAAVAVVTAGNRVTGIARSTRRSAWGRVDHHAVWTVGGGIAGIGGHQSHGACARLASRGMSRRIGGLTSPPCRYDLCKEYT